MTFRFFYLLIIPALLLIYSCSNATGPEQNSVVKVALYNGANVWSEDVIALNKMFQWMGYEVTTVNTNIILGNNLSDYDILCIPGGFPSVFSEDFGPAGMQKIRDFVDNGGCYMGFCGGTMLAVNKVIWNGQVDTFETLGLVNADAIGPITGFSTPSMQTISMNTEHPAVSENPEEDILYVGGPYCRTGGGVETVGTYSNGKKAIVSAEYGSGKVVLFCVHPEFEEDSDRDGVDTYDTLEDAGSDWEMVKALAEWAIL